MAYDPTQPPPETHIDRSGATGAWGSEAVSESRAADELDPGVRSQLGDLASRTAGALRRGGRYLSESGPTGVRRDLEGVMRRRPLETLLAGLGIGALIGLALRRRS